jgi:hypothetical protein
MIQRFLQNKPLGLQVPVVIPSALPPQAALSDDGGRHLEEGGDEEGSNDQDSFDWRRYCSSSADKGVALRGGGRTEGDGSAACILALRFDLGPLALALALPSASASTGAYLSAMTEMVRLELAASLRVPGGDEKECGVEVRVWGFFPAGGEESAAASALGEGGGGSYLMVEAVLRGSPMMAQHVTQLLHPSTTLPGGGAAWLEGRGGVVLQKESVSNVHIYPHEDGVA